jgi:hypothetical protein
MSASTQEVHPDDLSPVEIQAFSNAIAVMSGYTTQLRRDQLAAMGAEEYAA